MDKKKTGQYFTISEVLQQFIFDKVKYKGSPLLEPSFGVGHLLKKFKELDDNYPMYCYELNEVTPIVTFNDHQHVIYADFTKQPIGKFKTIIGNPPYVKQRTGNLYLTFVELCYEYLSDDGELLFIVPSDFMKATRASSIIQKMIAHGSFTDFLFPNDENLFEGASIDVVAFRYEKGMRSNRTMVNGKQVFCNVNKGILTFSENEQVGTPLESKFHVYVGLVSGRDEIYKVPIGNIKVLNDKEKVDTYIFPESFPTENEVINKHLQNNKQALLSRKIKKFSEANWFEWGAPRNLCSIRKYMGKDCIYIRNMTRQKEVAFAGKVQYFGVGLLCLVPKEGELTAILDYLNSDVFKKEYMYAGRFKIGHKQISMAILPN